jgi:hypothetical protein
MRKVFIALLLLFIVAVSTTLYAVEVTITVLEESAPGSENFVQVYTDAAPRGGPAAISVNLEGLICWGDAGKCIFIDSGSTAQFAVEGGTLGQLLLSPFGVTNLGTNTVIVRVEYNHAHTGANATQAQCAAMSIDGFTIPSDGIGQGDYVSLSMNVAWQPCTGKNCGPFQIGAQGSVPCPNTAGGVASPATQCDGVPCLFHDVSVDNFYFPPNPPQVVNLLPAACGGCDTENAPVSAVISKRYEARLMTSDYNNMVGTGLGIVQVCGDPKKTNPKGKRPGVCTAQQENPSLAEDFLGILEAQQGVVDVHNANPDTKTGQILVDIFSNLAFDCTTDIDYLTLIAMAELNVPGAPLKQVTFQTGFCRAQFDVSDFTNFTCAETRYVTLQDKNGIIGADAFACP